MESILYQYQLNLTTWVYLSSLLTIAIYFKFSRLWSVRNLDLLGLIAMAPGLLLVDTTLPDTAQQIGWIWLFVWGALFMLRFLVDPMMVRRPLLEPNMTTGGLTFVGICLTVFLVMNVLTSHPTDDDLQGARQLDAMLAGQATKAEESGLAVHGPGYPWLHALPSISSRALAEDDLQRPDDLHVATARTTAIISHLLVIIGMVLVAVRHFDNVRTGIAAATLYLLLPYTAQMTGRVDHVVPAALLVWAILMYRHPLFSGMLLGLASGAIYYPLFLLPLWIGFYWQRGLVRFLVGVVTMLSALVASLAFISSDMDSFLAHARQMFGWTTFSLQGVDGFWALSDSLAPYRIPVLVLFVVMSFGFALWPAPKNLGTLMSCSGAVMLGTQFWHAQQGGLYAAWYLPLLLLVIFRPNLEDRVAITTLDLGWLARRRWQSKAA